MYIVTRQKFKLISVLLLLLLLVACRPPTGETPPVPTGSEIQSTFARPPTPFSTPTAPDIPTEEQPVAILVDPAESGLAGPVEETLAETISEFAQEHGLELVVRKSLAPADVTPNVRFVVVLPPDPGLASLAAASSQTRFLGIDIADLEPGENLSVIAPQPGEKGFLAGYLAAVVTQEWRVGVIAASDTQEGTAAREGFLNGAAYFCGLCRQTYPPYYTYPMYAEAPAGASAEQWQAAADTLINQNVETVYVAPGVGDEDLLNYLAQAGVNIIGSGPAPAALKTNWVASIEGDYENALEEALPKLLSGEPGARFSPALGISDVNPDLLSPGRQRLVEALNADLSAGAIDTGVSEGSQIENGTEPATTQTP